MKNITDYINKTNAIIATQDDDKAQELLETLVEDKKRLLDYPQSFGFDEAGLEMCEDTLEVINRCIEALVNLMR